MREELGAFLEVADRSYRLEKRASAHLLEGVIGDISGLWEQQGQLTDRMDELEGEAGRLQE